MGPKVGYTSQLVGRGRPPILAMSLAGLPGNNCISAMLEPNSSPSRRRASFTSGRMAGATPVSAWNARTGEMIERFGLALARAD